MTPRPYPYMVRRVKIGDTWFYDPVGGYPDRLTNRPAQAAWAPKAIGPMATVIKVENAQVRVTLTPALRVVADVSPAALTPQQAAD